jgi:hypothetical protein
MGAQNIIFIAEESDRNNFYNIQRGRGSLENRLGTFSENSVNDERKDDLIGCFDQTPIGRSFSGSPRTSDALGTLVATRETDI